MRRCFSRRSFHRRWRESQLIHPRVVERKTFPLSRTGNQCKSLARCYFSRLIPIESTCQRQLWSKQFVESAYRFASFQASHFSLLRSFKIGCQVRRKSWTGSGAED